MDLPSAELNEEAEAERKFGGRALGHLRSGFELSRHPMLISDDHRRLVAGNLAACRLLGLARTDVPWLSMDRFTPPDEQMKLENQWASFLASGAAEGCYRLQCEGGVARAFEFGATANVLPSRHLFVFVSPRETSDEPGDAAKPWAPTVAEACVQPGLTEREREIMTFVATGWHGAEIAARLFLSPETVKSHVQNAMGKLGSHTRAHAVATALVTRQITLEA